MNLNLKTTIQLEVTTEEFRLISKGLRGKLVEADMDAALALQKEMLRLRHVQLTQVLQQSQQAIDNIIKAEER